MYTHILVPVDGSDTADRALHGAIDLAKEQGAALRVVHVLDTCIYWDAGFVPMDIHQINQALRDRGQEILAHARDAAQAGGIEAEVKLIETATPARRVANVIIDEAQDWPADLIVIGTHGRRGLDHLLLGSVAEAVVRLARQPVLLIRSA